MQDDQDVLAIDSDTVSRSPIDDLSRTLGRNLRRIRTRNGLSLERLAATSGVSRAMLGQIETGKSVPTIKILWKISTALGVPFAALAAMPGDNDFALLRRDEAKVLVSSDNRFSSRALFPFDAERRAEFYELRVAPRHIERAEAHAPGTRENIVVAAGTIEIAVAKRPPVVLSEGDAVEFLADVPHSYRNPGASETLLYLVMTYVEEMR